MTPKFKKAKDLVISINELTYKKENIEETSNKYTFYGNNKRPFTVITWLCPKSIPGGKNKPVSSSPTKGTAGFLFYQNREGFNFKSMDSLMSGLKLNTTDRRNI